MKYIFYAVTLAIILLVLLFAIGAIYVVDETQQVVITQFGEPIGSPITEAGLHFKYPVIQHANYFDKRILEWDGNPKQINTADKKYIFVDTTARWKIVDALKFMQSVGNESQAQGRLDDIVDAATRTFVTSNMLVETARNSNRLLDAVKDQTDDVVDQTSRDIERIKLGREKLTREILAEASKTSPNYGIQLIDVRIKRINYISQVEKKVFERMISERKRAAEQYRSEGQGKKAEIEGRMGKELNRIRSEAYKVAEEIKGKADAEAIEIYADAYNRDPGFYSFLQTLRTYEDTFDRDTTVILSTDSEYYGYLKNAGGEPQ